jgi:polyhydroxybutyrate depolymerase
MAPIDRRDPGARRHILSGVAAPVIRNLHRLALAAAILGAAGVASAQPAPLDLRLAHDGRERRYLLQLPAARPNPAPLVVVLHGGGGGGADAVAFDQPSAVFREIAEREGFLVAYPEGVGAVWNDCRSENTLAVSKADDVGFLVALVAELVASRGADPGRLFLTGASNGGMMALRVAAEAPGVFAAIAPTIANEPVDPRGEYARPQGLASRTALLLMNGTLDPWMPWFGGAVVNDPARGFVRSTRDTLARFVDRNGCSGKFAQRALPDLDPGDGSILVEQRWLGCAPDAPLVAVNVVGGGHCLPSRTRFGCIGRQNRDAEAAELLWAFFREVPPRRP